ncbi:hypothetical protein G7Z17_g12158 [Cylindrodendrum hubeiense]|uniref:Methyltransferase type 12 domain-containing protein n=1 Tax=Cylindrodendrum hubeiense TaxID=595255 RepID=A0A9P5GYX2_9HYPO|nr:hypothetical protein G7Z17_g12158 [Cylindrodendrum hubeiense]
MASTTPHPIPSQNAGSRLYSSRSLSTYDFWVLWLSNSYAWKCPTKDVLLPLFGETLGERHLDVGVGSGYFPSKTFGSSKCREVTLADVNPVSLATSERNITTAVGDSVKVDTFLADATEPLPLPPSRKFDSISLYYLLHCMPGPPSRKTAVFSTMRPHLADDGVLIGATILGRQAPMNAFAWALMSLYNHLGIFDNWEDTREEFEAGLRREFDEVDVRVVGRVMVFTARKPKTVAQSNCVQDHRMQVPIASSRVSESRCHASATAPQPMGYKPAASVPSGRFGWSGPGPDPPNAQRQLSAGPSIPGGGQGNLTEAALASFTAPSSTSTSTPVPSTRLCLCIAALDIAMAPPSPQLYEQQRQQHQQQQQQQQEYHNHEQLPNGQQHPQPPPYYFPQFPPQPYVHDPAAPHPPRRRPPRAVSLVHLARPFSLVIPAVIVVLNIWWSVSQRVCPSDAGVGHTCFWVLWLSLPVATLSFVWAIASNISARRASHHMSYIPPRIHATIQLLLATGATICFALLIYHLVHFKVWSRSSEGAMAALLGILMIADWVIFAWTAYEITLDHRAHQLAASQIPI